MTNAKNLRHVTISSVMRPRAFQAGVDDYHNGVWNADDWSAKHQSWHYERGRLWAAWCEGSHVARPKVKNGQRVNPAAKRLFAIALKDGGVI